MQRPFTVRQITIVALQAALIVALAGAGWLIYRQLPTGGGDRSERGTSMLQIVLRQPVERAREHWASDRRAPRQTGTGNGCVVSRQLVVACDASG